MELQAIVQQLRAEHRRAQSNPRDIYGFTDLGPCYPLLSYKLGGFQLKNLIVLASQPKVGKSMFASQLIPHMARKAKTQRKYVDVITLEMTEGAFLKRAAAIGAGIGDPQNIDRGRLTPDEARRYDAALSDLESLPIRFLSTSSNLSEADGLKTGNSTISIQNVQDFVRDDTMIWFLDHVGLLENLGRGENLRYGYVKVWQALARLAQSKVTGVCITHLQRDASGNLPSISNLSESNEGAKAADLLLLLSRPYFERKDKLSESELELSKVGEPSYVVFTSRAGASGLQALWWDQNAARFIELANNTPIRLPGKDQINEKKIPSKVAPTNGRAH